MKRNQAIILNLKSIFQNEIISHVGMKKPYSNSICDAPI